MALTQTITPDERLRAAAGTIAPLLLHGVAAPQQAVERIIEDARHDSLTTRGFAYEVYETHKRRLQALWLTPEQYEAAIRNLAAALNI